MKKLRWVPLLCMLGVQSCTMHPRYSRPEMAMPTEWRVPTEESSTHSNLCWWKQFGDPVLDALIDEALLNNQDLKVAISTVNEFVDKLGVARSALYPQISATIAAERNKISTTQQPFLLGTNPFFNAYTLLLNASYQVDIWGEIRSATEVVLANLLSSVEARRTVVLTIVSAVATAYIQLRQFDMQLFISYKTLDSRCESYNYAQTRYELGLTSLMEVEQAKSEVEEAQVEVDQLRISVAVQEDLLSFLIGKPSMAITRGRILNDIKEPPSLPVAIPSEIVNQRPDILAAEQNLIAANAQIGVAKAQFFPQINLLGTYGVESSFVHTLFKKPSTVWQYGVNILQEIFTGGELTYNLRLTEDQKVTLIHQYQSVILNAFKEVNDALISHKITLELVDVLNERVATLAEYLRLSFLRYQDGLTDYLTFLDAERQYFRAQLDYAQSLGDSFATLIGIYQALGGGWVVEADKYAEAPASAHAME